MTQPDDATTETAADANAADAIAADAIAVRGARENNLVGVDVDLPRDRLVVVTGASGGGKSSLLMGTVFAEGRRRFLSTLPTAARAAAGAIARPDVDRVEGLPPVVAVAQSMGRVARRSTVATLAEASGDLELLFARAGTAHCVACGQPLTAQTVDEIATRLLGLPERSKLIVLAPMGAEGEDAAATLDRVVAEGFVRVRIDRQTVEAAEAPAELATGTGRTIEAVVDRLIVKPGIEERLRESLDLAIEQGDGRCLVTEIVPDGPREGVDRAHSTRFACGPCGVSYPNPEPRLFRFQSPYGACDRCRGAGETEADDGTISTCGACEGQRLQPFARAVTLGDRNLPAVWAMRPAEVRAWLDGLEVEDPIGRATLSLVRPDLQTRCETLDRLGLGYLTLDRRGPTLSGGEAQRVRLVAALGSGLAGIAYLLDEPTAGLHAADTQLLLDSLRRLQREGNTVAVIEHDQAVIDAADTVIEIGPGGGRDGGRLVYAGPPRTDDPSPPVPATIDPFDEEFPFEADEFAEPVRLRGASVRTLQAVDVEIPLARITGLSGVSGSGKSTLMHEVLLPAARAALDDRPLPPGLCDDFELPAAIGAVAVVSQQAAGRSGRSTPATLLGLWSLVRSVFARTRVARLRGYDAKRFSFNNKAGTCLTCRGRGRVRLRSSLLADELVTCPDCRGLRFDEATLEVQFKGHTLADVLAMTIDEAAEVFANIRRLAEPLERCGQVGLGYLTLGQPAETLSGGELQRLKLLRTLGADRWVPTLYLLDEPTGGLHRGEVDQLTGLLRLMTRQGHTFVVIEHHLRLLAACDHLIDLGPGAGPSGGRVVAAGPPSEVARADTPTGRALAAVRASK